MNRRKFLELATIALLSPVAGHAQDISWKIQEDLIQLLNGGNYPRYPDTDLADIHIIYKTKFSAMDWAILSDMGAKREMRDQKTIRAGMTREQIMEYAKRPNVEKILPNHYGEGIK
ncbi:hypothetical protein HYV80_02170 [Candidatus Woesearchaeota archaeon]|nr:hypothetical protein [Candidatus Woesearchaeota archaeon]